jgi:hypothetical protein
MKLTAFYALSSARSILSIICLVLLPFYPAWHCFAGESRTFTDSKGQKITAEIVSVQDSTVTFSIKGKQFPYPISKLSESDQKHIQAWAALQSHGTDGKVTIEGKKKREERIKTKAANKTVVREDWVFEITVSNDSSDNLKGLELRSRVYKWNAQVGGDKEELEVVTSKQEITELAGGDKKSSYKIPLVSLYTTVLDGTYSDGSSPKKEDRLEGAWVRLYQGDKLLGEFKDDTPTLKMEKWPEEKK